MLGLVIPVKRLDSAKMRLSASLGPDERRTLTLAMLADVLRASEHISQRFVVTKDPDAEAVALANGCAIHADPGEGLNAAIDSAVAFASGFGIDRSLVIPSDVPTVTASDLRELERATYQVVIARSVDGGTNGLMLQPPDAIPASFGPGSADVHRAKAQSRGWTVRMFDLASLRRDIDDVEDLTELARTGGGTQSGRFARSILAI